MESFAQVNSPGLLSKASLTPSLFAQATDRDHGCVFFSGVCDLNELTLIENVICGRKDIIALFWENKLGVDVDDNHRINTIHIYIRRIIGQSVPSLPAWAQACSKCSLCSSRFMASGNGMKRRRGIPKSA
ncbi:hypothetical protein Agabi119p4_6165 [Agaricus bisporus var. burnettii]|uniref:Uncharacterized protein n=1 Tax=Agaricus bisporus var. burnettii TaxID=192524 RepID=A0A8H7KGA7_AGABI|nr:hypothetical protein Agabi119p4_6165 [Agaricus bisporus var. burnettii]